LINSEDSPSSLFARNMLVPDKDENSSLSHDFESPNISQDNN